MNCAMKCLHRSFDIFRASLRSMPTLETIEEVYEEVYDMEPIGEPPDLYDLNNFDNKDWIHWQSSDWGQWTDIEYKN